MFGVLEDPVFERGVEILEAVGARRRRIDRAEEGVGRAERYREILGDPLGKLAGNIALPHRRNVAGVEAVDGWKRQLVVDAGIVDAERGREEAIADDLVGSASLRGTSAIASPDRPARKRRIDMEISATVEM